MTTGATRFIAALPAATLVVPFAYAGTAPTLLPSLHR
jgi:hypothetical protein